MIKKSITPQDACDLLNEFLKLDRDCVHGLIAHRQECKEAIANHPTIQVQQLKDDKFPKVGIVGILNGMFGIDEDGMGAIFYDEGDNGEILCFKVLSV